MWIKENINLIIFSFHLRGGEEGIYPQSGDGDGDGFRMYDRIG